MELRVLSCFLAVAREENVTRAAQALHLSQPTLSRQLAQMEEELGVKLFERGKRKIALTSDGVPLRRRAKEILELAGKAERGLREQATAVEGTVAVGCGDLDGVRLLPGLEVDITQHGVEPANLLFRELFDQGSVYAMVCWNKLFAARLWKDLRFDTSFVYGDDGNIMHLLLAGQAVVCLDETLYHYRLRRASLTGTAFRPERLDDLRLWNLWYTYFLQHSPDLAQRCLTDYWRRFYRLYLLARESGPPDGKVRQAFARYLPQLRELLPALLRCPCMNRDDLCRLSLFSVSPVLAYRLAHTWGVLVGRFGSR